MSKEQDIKKGNLKITVFKEFPMAEMFKINQAMEELGYTGSIASNGNIVFQKKEDVKEVIENVP